MFTNEEVEAERNRISFCKMLSSKGGELLYVLNAIYWNTPETFSYDTERAIVIVKSLSPRGRFFQLLLKLKMTTESLPMIIIVIITFVLLYGVNLCIYK